MEEAGLQTGRGNGPAGGARLAGPAGRNPPGSFWLRVEFFQGQDAMLHNPTTLTAALGHTMSNAEFGREDLSTGYSLSNVLSGRN